MQLSCQPFHPYLRTNLYMCQSTLLCKNGLSCSTIPLLILIFTILILLLFLFTQTFSGTICIFPTIFSWVGMFSLSDFWKLSLTCKFFSTCYSLLCPPNHLLCPCRLAITNSAHLVDYPISQPQFLIPSFIPAYSSFSLLPLTTLTPGWNLPSAASNSNSCSCLPHPAATANALLSRAGLEHPPLKNQAPKIHLGRISMIPAPSARNNNNKKE